MKRTLLSIVSALLLCLLAGLTPVIAQDGEATEAVPVTLTTLPEDWYGRTADGGYVVGSPDAPLSVVMFTDFACPSCQQYRDTLARFIDAHVLTGAARLEIYLLPTAGGRLTGFVSRVTQCLEAEQPGAFWEAHDILYDLAAARRYDAGTGREISETLGLDYDNVLACTATANADADLRLAQTLGVFGTPALLVRYGDDEPEWISDGGRVYDRGGVPFEVLERVVEGGAAATEAALS